MMLRRHLIRSTPAILAGVSLGAPPGAAAAQASRAGSYRQFLQEIGSQARGLGIGPAVLDTALALDQPNAKVLQLDRHQPEFTLTWAQYRARVLTGGKLQATRQAYGSRIALLTALWQRYRVDPRVVTGIWGLESNFGSRIGSFGVVDALATLAYDGRRAAFFRAELLNALRILQQGDVAVGHMLGSYAGAMGQPQFMPSSFLRYAVDYEGNGRRDIWTSEPDALASIANYLRQCGWVAGMPWGQPVRLPPGFDGARIGRQHRLALGAWSAMGVRRADGGRFSRSDVRGAVVAPDGSGGDAFMVYENFDVIRRYNPSDFYALAVGLLGDAAT